MRKSLKQKKCKICQKLFSPWISSTQNTCSPSCAIKKAENDRGKILERSCRIDAKRERKRLRERKESLKTRSDYEKEAQASCNAYIRQRDKHLPCISCGTTNPNIQYCAGHYKTVGGYPELRYHPMNINKQCNFHCNSQKSGNIDKYRPELIKKIGLSNVEWLDGHHKPQNRTVDDLKDIKIFYREQAKYIS